MGEKLGVNISNAISFSGITEIFEGLSDGFIGFDGELEILFKSPKAEALRIFKNTKNLKDIFSPKTIDTLLVYLKTRKNVFHLQTEFFENDTKTLFTYGLVFPENESPYECVLIIEKIFDTIPNAAINSINSISLDYSNEIVIFLDDKFNYSFISKSFKKLLDYKDYEVLGLSLFDLLHPDKKRECLEALSKLNSGEEEFSCEKEVGFRSKEGKYLYFKCTINKITNINKSFKFIITGIDVTNFKENERKLEHNMQFFQNIYDASPDIIFLSTIKERKIVSCNKRALELLGYKNYKEILGRNTSSFRKYPISSFEMDEISKLYENGGELNYEIEWNDSNNKGFWVSINIKKITISGIDYELKRVTDISRIKSFETLIKLSEQRQNLYLQQTPLGYIEWNLNFEVMEWNPSSERIFGYSKKEALGNHASFIIPKEVQPEIIDVIWKELLGRKGGNRSSNINISKEGKVIHCEWYNTPLVDSDGNVIGVASMVLDVTESVLAEEKIMNSLKEKEVLLSEIHHRVKNNLAVVSGLLFLQSEAIKDSNAKQLFKESETRIKSMALIHEKLYTTENFSDINILEYFSDLSQSILASYAQPGDVEFLFDIDEKKISINTALNYGLILNELITNSIKYAFNGIAKPQIKISWHQTNLVQTFIYSDNGHGFDWEHAVKKGGSIGLDLVNTLAMQLKGNLEYSPKHGSTFKITSTAN